MRLPCNNMWLYWLGCGSNQLTALDVSKNTKLEVLSCSRNRLTTLDVSKTNLENSIIYHPFACADMPTLQTLYLKTGWKINGINVDRSTGWIPAHTKILYKN